MISFSQDFTSRERWGRTERRKRRRGPLEEIAPHPDMLSISTIHSPPPLLRGDHMGCGPALML